MSLLRLITPKRLKPRLIFTHTTLDLAQNASKHSQNDENAGLWRPISAQRLNRSGSTIVDLGWGGGVEHLFLLLQDSGGAFVLRKIFWRKETSKIMDENAGL
jgi:hypothetical protein